MPKTSFILASSSPRRVQLLKKIGIVPNKIISPNINETILDNEDPTTYVKRIALEKVLGVFSNHDDSIILAADTIVVKGRRILGKPTNKEDAYNMISLLSGGRHKVLTSFAVCYPNCKKPIVKVVKTSVLIKKMSQKEINWFLSSNEWEDKSGSYAIQGIFELFIKQINGSVSSVVGLPLLQVYNVLLGVGYPFDYSYLDQKESV